MYNVNRRIMKRIFLVMENDIYINIDESGTLSKNIKNPQCYLYAGYWCLKQHSTSIESGFGRELMRFFPSCANSEKKASSMKNRKKMLLLKGIKKREKERFHPVFVVEDLTRLNKGLTDSEEIQLHKNYLLRRFVEKCLENYRRIYPNKAKRVILNIDDQSKTQLQVMDPFPEYINKVFKNYYRNNKSSFTSDADFLVKYRDSNKYRCIQICDILANCKYNHYVHKRKDIEKVFSRNDIYINKLP